MEKQNNSPLNFLTPRLMDKIRAFKSKTVGSMPQDISSGGMISAGVQAAGAQAPTPADATMGSAPAPAAMGSADNSNPFGGRTFTISPAQMRNVENVFGDTSERQASVGQGVEQSSENYDVYGEESPLMKKSCGSYKK